MENKLFGVYLAGKIRKNDWRQIVVPNHRSALDDSDIGKLFFAEYEDTAIRGLYTTGPFFISCNHGCYHGKNSHGVAAGREGCGGKGVSAEVVPMVCMEQIRKSDFVFAYIDAESCFGTLCEIGYAVGIGKPVAVMFADEELRTKMWFTAEVANIEFNKEGDLLRSNIRDAKVNGSSIMIAELLGGKYDDMEGD